MKPYQLLSVGSAASSPLRPRRLKRRQTRLGLALLLACCLSLVFLTPAYAADGALDPSFITGSGQYAGVQNIPEIRGQYGYSSGNTGGVNWPYNGRSLLFGTFYGVKVGNVYPPNGGGNSCIARLAADGTLDNTFNVNGPDPNNRYQINGEIRGVFIYPHNYPVADLQDKILVWGRFNAGSGSTYYSNLARLNANGDLDTTFPHLNSWGGAVNTVAVQGVGFNGAFVGNGDKILVGGFNLRAGSDDMGPTYQLVRLDYLGNPDGNFTHWGAPNGYINSIKIVSDPTFGNNNVRLFCNYPKNQNGSGGSYYFLLLNADANLPSTSPPIAFIGDETVDGPIFNMAMQSNGQWVIGGQFKKVFGTSRNRIARLTYSAGAWTLDSNYDAGVGPNGTVTGISPMNTTTLNPDDRMVVTGVFDTWNGAACGFMVRLNTDGTQDTFNNGGTGADDRIRGISWKTDGTGGWIYGYFRNYNSAGTNYSQGGIAGLNADGTRNSNFSNVTAQAGWPGMVYSLATQSDGKIIIGGDFNGVGGKYRGGIARINPNGSLDTSFTGGVDGYVQSVAVQADGKILLCGNLGQCQGYPVTSLARLNPDSSLDTAFKPMLVGEENSLNTVNHVVPLSNGQIMIAGDIWNATGGAPVARLNSNGSLDSSFWQNVSNIPNPFPGAEWAWGTRVAVAGNNYLLAGGYSLGDYNSAPGFLGRITSSGNLDTSFSPNTPVANFQTMDGMVDDLLVQPDGKIMVSGRFSHIFDGSGSGPARSAIARFSANGSLDSTFTPNLTMPTGANTIALAAMARQPDGKILIEENFLNISGMNNVNYLGSQVARLNPDGSLDPNFTLGIATNGWFYPGGGSSILRLPNGKALIGGCFGNYNSSNPPFKEWSLVRIFAGPAGFSPGPLYLLLEN